MSAKILVVDDEPLYLRLLEESLKLEKYVVLKADNGQDAVKIVSKEDPDLVVMDVMMPDMDGWDLIETIRADDRWKQMPIIVMTASIQEHIRLLSESERDMKPILTQPITSRELNEAVSRCLQTAVLTG